MALSKLFKKSLKRKPQKLPEKASKNDILGSPALQKKRFDAAIEVMELFERYFKPTQGNVHPETVLFAAAWLAGTSLHRSFGYAQKSEPGTIILSEKANQEWPELMELFMFYLQKKGVNLKSIQLETEVLDKHKPQKTILEIQEEFQDDYHAIMKKHRFDYVDGARAGIIACAMVFDYHCVNKKDLDPRLGAGIIGIGLVGGAKTSPLPLNPQKVKARLDNSTQDTPANVSRFVIGDLGDVISDIGENGGQYLQLNPLVEAKLKEANIDPEDVYIKGLESQLEAKVSRVDFVKMNLDEILCQEKNNQMPIPVFLAHWLHDKAEEYGYKREGNSWVIIR